jgi:hypothetical protein
MPVLTDHASQTREASAAVGSVTAGDLLAFLDSRPKMKFRGGRDAVERLCVSRILAAGLQFAKVTFAGPYFYCVDTRTNGPLFFSKAPRWAQDLDRVAPPPAWSHRRTNTTSERLARSIRGDASGAAA